MSSSFSWRYLVLYICLAWGLAWGLLLAQPSPLAHAATCTVTTNADNGAGSLREKIADPTCTTINFANDYTITLTTTELAITRNMTIDGVGRNITISGGNAVRVFYVNASTAFTLTNLTVADGNDGHENGGGMYNLSSGTLLTNVTFRDNFAHNDGAGMYNNNSSPTLTNVTFSGNAAVRDGGGMYNNNSSPTLTNVTFSGNVTGMFNDHSSPMLTNITFIGNPSYALSNRYGSPTLTNVTFGNDQIGIINFYSSNPSITNATFGNSIYAIWSDYTSNFTVLNSIFWGNAIHQEAPAYPPSSVANSVIQDGCPSYVDCSNIITVDPLLGTLGNYGGSTQTIPLLPGSSAIDATNANCPLTDQRGVARGSTCDIGAFESRGFTLTKSHGDNQSTAINTAFANPLSVTLNETGGSVLPGGTITFTAPSSGASIAAPTTVTTTTNASGIASLPITANGTIGAYTVTASARGASNVNFALTNTCPSAITVTNNLDNGAGSLRQAIADVCPGGTIAFSNNYTITLASQLTIDKGMTIDGVGRNITVSGGNAVRVFYVNASTAFTLTNLTVANGQASGDGGGMYNLSSGTTLTNVTFSSNSADYGGGGMFNLSSNPTLTNVTFSGNKAGDGGGMYNDRSSPTLTNVTFSGNSASENGGGMYNLSSNPTLTNVTFSGNSASAGGGMYNADSYPTLTNATFSGNSAINGGGMYDLYSNSTLTNVTFSGNSATNGYGGGMYNYYGNPVLTNVTFSGNNAYQGGGMLNNNSQPTLKNVIIANSTGGNCFGNSSTGSNNLADDGTCGATFTNSSSILLGTLGNYGGGTMTVPLLPGSSAIDATSANCPLTDQRGVARGSTCDIGAFESRGFTLTKSGGDNQSAVINTAFANPLALNVTSAFTEPVNGGKVVLTAPSSGASISGTTPIALTIASGAVSQNVSANNTTGTYTVTALAGGAFPAIFSLTNTNPSPTLVSINPTSASVNAPAFTLTVTGTNFINGSIVRWNGSNRVTTFVSSTTLTTAILKTDLEAARTISVTVFTPAPGGGTSNSVPFTVNPTNSTVSVLLASSCNPCFLKQTVRITATVTNTVGVNAPVRVSRPRDAVPTGTVTFKDGGNNIAGCVNVALNGAGQAVCVTSALQGGSHAITAQYIGDSNFNAATGNLTQNISYLLLLPGIKRNSP